MQIYIDESGNLGVDGRYFVIAAILPSNPKRVKNLVKNCCLHIGKETGTIPVELKGSDLSLPQRQNFINRLISKDDFSCSYIVADKNHLLPKILEDKNVCFNYLASHLLKPILKGLSEDAQIIFDNHTVKVTSLNSLEDYIKIEAYTKWGFQHDLSIEFKDSKNYRNLQAVDVLSNTIYRKFDKNVNYPYDLLLPKFGYKVRFPFQKFGT